MNKLLKYIILTSTTRYNSNKTATLKCGQESDRFSTTSSRGNGNLTYPVALITADEVAFAGGKDNVKNEEYYLRTNNSYFTMTPASSDALIGDFRVYTVVMSGSLYPWYSIVNFHGIRPVINIRSDVLIQEGDGTIENPFILELA